MAFSDFSMIESANKNNIYGSNIILPLTDEFSNNSWACRALTSGIFSNI